MPLLAYSAQDLPDQLRVIPDPSLYRQLDERTQSGKEPQQLGPAEKPKGSRNLQTGGERCPPAFPFIDTDALDPLLQGELNDRRFPEIESRERQRGRPFTKRRHRQPGRLDVRMTYLRAPVELVSNLLGTDELERQAADDVQSLDSRERDQRPRIDDDTFSHS